MPVQIQISNLILAFEKLKYIRLHIFGVGIEIFHMVWLKTLALKLECSIKSMEA